MSKKLKSHDDDEAEHSRCGGFWHGVSMQRHCDYCMHKDNTNYKNDEQRRDKCCHCGGEFKECARRQSAGAENAQERNVALKGYGTESIKWRRTESARGVQKTLMQTGQSNVTEQQQGW